MWKRSDSPRHFDVKRDMEGKNPWTDLGGRMGLETEVAMRAAFKAVEEKTSGGTHAHYNFDCNTKLYTTNGKLQCGGNAQSL